MITNLDKSRVARPLNIYVCSQCNKVFKKKTTLDEHVIKKHEIFERKDCYYKTTDEINLKKHNLIHSGANSELFSCHYCNAKLKRRQILDNHIVRKHPDFLESVKRKIHECSQCMYKTVFKPSFKRHLLMHGDIGCSSEQQSICEHCNAAFKSKRLLDAHIVKQHPKFIASVTSKIHKCSYCTYKTIHNGHFDAHLLIHSKGKTPTCEHCASTFKRKQLLNNHILKKHSDVFGSVSSKVSCQQCHVKFEGRQSLNKHMMETHPDHAASVKITPCKHCTMTFNSKYDLDDHIVRKHQEFIGSVTRKVFECSYCSYKTVRTNKSEKHILSHRRKVGLNQTPIKEEQTTDST
nr:unnamed protein product [Callosobruchus chinensis]